MKRMLFVALLAVTIAPALAQQRAPHNDSIRQDDLRADLFFLAGDAMKGRLTDTDENRATADYIRSRFERAGLKPAARQFLFSELRPDDVDDRRRRQRDRDRPARSQLAPFRLGTGLLSASLQRQRSGECRSHVRRLRDQRAASAVTTTMRIARRSPAGSSLILDHEPGERDPKSPFDGVVTTEPAAAWRKALAAQEHGAIGILFVSDVHNHPDRGELRTGGTKLSGRRRRRASRATRSQPGPIAFGFRSRRFHRRSPPCWSPTAARRSRSCRSPPKRRAVQRRSC